MDSKFSLGILFSFILGGVGSIIGPQLWIAIGLFVVASILAFLFVNPKSPVRRRWWSISNRLGIVLINYGPTKNIVGIGDKYLTIHVGLRAISDIQVDKIELKIGRNSLLSDWKSSVIQGDEPRYINFTRPNWLRKGQYKSHLVARTPDGFSKSKKFPVKVDE